MESTLRPLAGLFQPTRLKALYYGPQTVRNSLLSCLPSISSKALIVTVPTLATKTPLIKQIEQLLGSRHHASTIHNIKEHAPIAQIDEASNLAQQNGHIDTVISVGGGSPIDSAKAISYRMHNKNGRFLTHISIPTTLSAAETTAFAGFTTEDGVKSTVYHPDLQASYVLYDPSFARHTPPTLFTSTGIRGLDHAVEMQYHPTATVMPCRQMALGAIHDFFNYLPQYHRNPTGVDDEVITRLYLASFSSMGFLGLNMKGGLGLSHALGYALGSPYGIPHGITSCLTLGHVVKVKARSNSEHAASVAAILTALGLPRSGNDIEDADKVGDRILGLVADLGLNTTLTEKGVSRDQIDIITARATGLKPGTTDTEEQKTWINIRTLVQNLY
jgi:alcohol dehydrogenase class IV